MSCDGIAIGWPDAGDRMLFDDIISTEASICASGDERNVHRHLVAVEVGVERRADERMDPDRLALDEHRLERLDAQPMQRRRAVQQDGMLADDFLEDVPHLARCCSTISLACLMVETRPRSSSLL